MYHCQYLSHKYPIILILDSGVGGLFIYEEVYKILPYVCYVYVFDNMFFPYGEQSETFITQRVIFIIETVCKKHLIDLAIIACNTISVVSLKILRIYFSFPIIGVVPAIQLASRCTKNGVIGVLATYRTIQHYYIIKLIKYFAYKHKVVLLESSELVKLAESKLYGYCIQKLELQNILNPWLQLIKIPDTIVLGCTHFSLLKTELKSILPISTCLIDSGKFVGCYTKYLLDKLYQKHSVHNCINVYQNTVYCTISTPNIKKIKSVLLYHYNFFDLKTLF